ncbi:MAG TPA: TadE/TadG family type IV pilus assembly protein [Candidatus Limnocylindria bacterium]|nr:TadE/TadG family type IV pilus assembly protein [Candidatus Limnocylindria bacterium]
MVEFALVLPIFLVLVIGLMEFSVAFNALLGINFASRDAALLAAEAASDTGSDCVILQSIERDVDAPANRSRIQEVVVYWATDTGGVQPGNPVNVYRRTGSTTCSLPDGATITVPYSLVGAAGYPEDMRCDVLAGCGGGHDTVDTIGVSISYRHTWVTPLANIVTLGGSGFEFTHSNAMRMEPSL